MRCQVIARIAAGLGVLVVAMSTSAVAVPYNFGGDVTLNTGVGSTLGVVGGIAYGTRDTFLFEAPTLSINAAECGGACSVHFDRTLSGSFSAAPGRIITSVSAGVFFGPSSTILGTYGISEMTWVVGGGSYTGSLSDGDSFTTGAYLGNWSVTGPNAGRAWAFNGANSGAFLGDSRSTAPYSINATTFALDISHMAQMGTSSGGGYFGPLKFGVTVFTAEAPPPPLNGVPLPSSMAIIGLGLLGFGATRRRMAA
ncbi:MAG: PEP-CTERM sorting domain-containing protein [Rhodospirillaceae bacterium]|nr:PEP-CTERM sorting domain-containing protein [Rhodospirillaceae bacterium]